MRESGDILRSAVRGRGLVTWISHSHAETVFDATRFPTLYSSSLQFQYSAR